MLFPCPSFVPVHFSRPISVLLQCQPNFQYYFPSNLLSSIQITCVDALALLLVVDSLTFFFVCHYMAFVVVSVGKMIALGSRPHAYQLALR